jgi:hypothetical protein
MGSDKYEGDLWSDFYQLSQKSNEHKMNSNTSFIKRGKKKIYFYTSGDIGSNIRNALNGEFYSDKVGTVNEDYYFKVLLSTGDFKSPNNSKTLFYNGPNEYENHFNVKLEQQVVDKWYKKFNSNR